jgi:hypothetical protein
VPIAIGGDTRGVNDSKRICGFCGRSSEELRQLHDPDLGQHAVLVISRRMDVDGHEVAGSGAICSLCVTRFYKSLQPGPKLTAGRPGRRGTSRDWLLQVGLPSPDLRDALAADVSFGVASLREASAVSIRGLEVIDVESGPAITLHIRTAGALSAAEVQKTALAELRHYAAELDLSGLRIEVTGRPSS